VSGQVLLKYDVLDITIYTDTPSKVTTHTQI